jgi:hypothetical protein
MDTMARTPKTPEQKAAEAEARAAAKAAKAAAEAARASESSADASSDEPSSEPSAEGEAELTLHDAINQLTDDQRMRPHWESSIRKFADNQGLGQTAPASKWRECLKKYGVKLK